MQIIAGLILLAVLIVVHEFGHFIVAKLMGVRVLTFSIGFGPRLLGWKKGHTDYRISAIPLGGYVSMYGDQLTDEIPEEERKFSFLHQPVWRKSLIAFAGPLFNFVLPVLLFFFLFWGQEKVQEPVIGTVFSGEAGMKGGLQSGDRVLSIDGQPIESFQQIVERISASPDQALEISVRHANGVDEILTVTPAAEPDHNPLKKGAMVGRIGVIPLTPDPIILSAPNSPAEQGGLRNFDRISSLNGVAISSAHHLSELMSRHRNSDWTLAVTRTDAQGVKTELVAIVKALPWSTPASSAQLERYAVNLDELEKGSLQEQMRQTRALLNHARNSLVATRGMQLAEAVIDSVKESTPAAELKLQRGDKIVSVDGAPIDSTFAAQKALEKNPDDIHVLGLQTAHKNSIVVFRMQLGKTDEGQAAPTNKEFGHTFFLPYSEGPTFERSVGPLAAFSRAVAKTSELIVMTLQSLWMLVSFQVSSSQISGPIAIFGVAGQAAEAGTAIYIFVMSLISVNLGLLNLLPIPVLDGGHLLMFGIEALQGRALSTKTRLMATKIGMMLLMALMALAIFNDLVRTFG